MQSLDEKEWAEFRIGDLFEVSRPTARNKDNYQAGGVPFVASGSVNNGVMKLCAPLEDEPLDKGGCITVSPVDGSTFYQPMDFLGRGGAGSSILMLRSDKLDLYRGLFMSRAIQQTCSKYTYGHMGNKDSIKRERVMLPVDDAGEPDYEYMAEYTRQKREAMLDKYFEYAEERVAELGDIVDIPALDEKEWKPFSIVGMFSSIVPGKGKGLNHLTKVHANGVNYIGATNRNNGVLCYIEENDYSKPMVLDGNCIGFIKNGDGSAGFAIYKAERFVSTSDVLYGYADWLNKYTGLFFVVAQDMIEKKYSHGYKRNKEHLAGDKIMLPVDDAGEPDYAYMEQYAKNMMLRKYRQYLAFLERDAEE